MFYTTEDATGKPKNRIPSSNATLLWKSAKPPPNLTRYNLTPFAITLNELTPGLQVEKVFLISFYTFSFSMHASLSSFIAMSDPGYLITD